MVRAPLLPAVSSVGVMELVRVVAQDPRLVIDVDNLGSEGWSFRDQVPAERVTALLNQAGPTELEALTPMDLQLRAYLAGDGLRLEGKSVVHLGRPCGRCLGPAPLPVSLALGITLFPAGRAPMEDAVEVYEGKSGRKGGGAPRKGKKAARNEPREPGREPWDLEDVATGTFEGGKVDVEEVLREQVLLEVPFTHVCRPDCKGLCPQCGEDLNAGPCGCAEAPTDSRWAGLANIKLN
jgi:uncharacterized protein